MWGDKFKISKIWLEQQKHFMTGNLGKSFVCVLLGILFNIWNFPRWWSIFSEGGDLSLHFLHLGQVFATGNFFQDLQCIVSQWAGSCHFTFVVPCHSLFHRCSYQSITLFELWAASKLSECQSSFMVCVRKSSEKKWSIMEQTKLIYKSTEMLGSTSYIQPK
jgi:hypothetical protein